MKFKIIGLLSLLTLSNLLLICLSPSTLVSAKLKTLSFSRGEKYFGLLNQWYFYAKNSQWSTAAKFEPSLNPVDISIYKSNHHPDLLSSRLVLLYAKPTKTASDWLNIAQFEAELSHFDRSLEAVSSARQLDPVNPNLSKLYFSLSSLPL